MDYPNCDPTANKIIYHSKPSPAPWRGGLETEKNALDQRAPQCRRLRERATEAGVQANLHQSLWGVRTPPTSAALPSGSDGSAGSNGSGSEGSSGSKYIIGILVLAALATPGATMTTTTSLSNPNATMVVGEVAFSSTGLFISSRLFPGAGSGVIGIKVRIMLGYDPTGMNGPKTMLPDQVIITEPKEDENMARPA